MSPTFSFDEEHHTYLLDGKIIPGTTKVLTDSGLIDYSYLNKEDLKWYMAKGNAVHRATEWWDAGELDEDSVDPEIAGRLNAWKLFRRDTGFEVQGSELPTYHPVFFYGVKPDRWGMLNGRLTLVEIKPETPEKWHILQRAANRAALVAHGIQIVADLNVYLSDDGTYKLSEKSSGRHEANEFFTLVTALQVKEKYRS